MDVYLIDGTYELFRHFFAIPPRQNSRGQELAATIGVLSSVTMMLESGDVFVFGGDARLRYHGVSRIVPDTAPAALALAGRFNLTFRQY